MADLLARHGKDSVPLQASPELLGPTISAVHSWIEVLLAAPQANRHQFVDVVRVIKRLPRSGFVGGLHQLLLEDLSRWHSARKKFFARPIRGPLVPGLMNSYTNIYRDTFAAIDDVSIFQIMKMYLSDLSFGIDAAYVLKVIWKRQHGIPSQDLFWGGPGFSEVGARRKQREERGYSETSSHAEAIFGAIESIVQQDCSEVDQGHAMQLAVIALSMPHGDKETVVNSLLLFPGLAQKKRNLLEALILAGETISAEMVLDSLRDFLADAKKQPWLLDQKNNRVISWLKLLPFSDHPAAADDAFDLVDQWFREPKQLRELLIALGHAPSAQAEQLLMKMANQDPRFFSEDGWLKAMVARGTQPSAMMLLDAIFAGKLTESARSINKKTLIHAFLSISCKHPEIKDVLIRRYESLEAGDVRSIIELAMIELVDIEGLLAMIRGYGRGKRHFDGTLERVVREYALGKQPSSDLGRNSYEICSVSTAELRKRWFEMLEGSTAEANIAESCLTYIDEIRDEYGRVDSDPRHPDIASGRPWPLVQYEDSNC
jgi:hypothetical protein